MEHRISRWGSNYIQDYYVGNVILVTFFLTSPHRYVPQDYNQKKNVKKVNLQLYKLYILALMWYSIDSISSMTMDGQMDERTNWTKERRNTDTPDILWLPLGVLFPGAHQRVTLRGVLSWFVPNQCQVYIAGSSDVIAEIDRRYTVLLGQR